MDTRKRKNESLWHTWKIKAGILDRYAHASKKPYIFFDPAENSTNVLKAVVGLGW